MRFVQIFLALILFSLFTSNIPAQENAKDCPPPHNGLIATLYKDQKKEYRKYEYQQLDYLADALKKCPNFVGWFRYYTKKGTKPKKAQEYINRLKQYLVKEKNILPERLIFYNFGIGKLSSVDIVATTRAAIPN